PKTTHVQTPTCERECMEARRQWRFDTLPPCLYLLASYVARKLVEHTYTNCGPRRWGLEGVLGSDSEPNAACVPALKRLGAGESGNTGRTGWVKVGETKAGGPVGRPITFCWLIAIRRQLTD